ncbi:hypothetical protein ILUMI_01147 [Ignelater luminosus]|uniref:Cuticle protein 6 n=1 Tax=Ignelater luminosus TaxID=2038154 RepID=A0A8K0DK90_IGNLU|nr:hypothetical protein ILUMI_01147 [Ignelater luminosus]
MELSALLLLGFLATSLFTISHAQFEPILRQSQEAGDLGEYTYGYESGLERKVESRSPDGSTRGMYSYIDNNGKVQVVKYTAGVEGFHAETSSLPIEGARGQLFPTHLSSHHSLTGGLGDTPEVIAARKQHAAAHAAALAVLPKTPQEPAIIHRNFHSGPVLSHFDHNGVIGDTAEVLAARRQHEAAHAAVRKTLPASHDTVFHGSTVFPARHFGHNDGIPRLAEDIPRSELGETPEVAAAREAHLAAYARAKASLPDREGGGGVRRFPF